MPQAASQPVSTTLPSEDLANVQQDLAQTRQLANQLADFSEMRTKLSQSLAEEIEATKAFDKRLESKMADPEWQEKKQIIDSATFANPDQRARALKEIGDYPAMREELSEQLKDLTHAQKILKNVVETVENLPPEVGSGFAKFREAQALREKSPAMAELVETQALAKILPHRDQIPELLGVQVERVQARAEYALRPSPVIESLTKAENKELSSELARQRDNIVKNCSDITGAERFVGKVIAQEINEVLTVNSAMLEQHVPEGRERAGERVQLLRGANAMLRDVSEVAADPTTHELVSREYARFAAAERLVNGAARVTLQLDKEQYYQAAAHVDVRKAVAEVRIEKSYELLKQAMASHPEEQKELLQQAQRHLDSVGKLFGTALKTDPEALGQPVSAAEIAELRKQVGSQVNQPDRAQQTANLVAELFANRADIKNVVSHVAVTDFSAEMLGNPSHRDWAKKTTLPVAIDKLDALDRGPLGELLVHRLVGIAGDSSNHAKPSEGPITAMKGEQADPVFVRAMNVVRVMKTEIPEAFNDQGLQRGVSDYGIRRYLDQLPNYRKSEEQYKATRHTAN